MRLLPVCLFLLASPLLGQDSGERRGRVHERDSTDTEQLVWEGLHDLLREAEVLENGALMAELFRSLNGTSLGHRATLRDGTPAISDRRGGRGGGIAAIVGREGLGQPRAVRGPVAVPFTSDLGGGVTDLRTRTPDNPPGFTELTGSVGYTYGVEREQHRPWGEARLNGGTWLLQANGAWHSSSGGTSDQQIERETGTFGGVAAVRMAERHDLALRYDGYRGGRDFADHRAASVESPEIARTAEQPRDDADRLALRYQFRPAGRGLVDQVAVTGWGLRDVTDDQSRLVLSYNRAGLGQAITEAVSHATAEAGGVRLEARSHPGRHLLAYGGSLRRESVGGRDSTSFVLTRTVGPDLTRSDTGLLPASRDDSANLFVLLALALSSRTAVVASGRHEWHRLERRDSSSTWTSQISALGTGLHYRASNRWTVQLGATLSGRAPSASDLLGRGLNLRSSGYIGQPGRLKAERSLAAQLGARYIDRQLIVAAGLFGGVTFDAIRLNPTGDTLLGLPVFRRSNSGTLRHVGAELTGILPGIGPLSLLATGGWTRSESIDGEWKDALRVLSALTWPDPRQRRFLSYEVLFRSGLSPDDPHLAEQELPDLMLHSIRGRMRLWSAGGTAHSAGIAITNLFDERWEGSVSSGLDLGLGREFLLSYRVDF